MKHTVSVAIVLLAMFRMSSATSYDMPQELEVMIPEKLLQHLGFYQSDLTLTVPRMTAKDHPQYADWSKRYGPLPLFYSADKRNPIRVRVFCDPSDGWIIKLIGPATRFDVQWHNGAWTHPIK